MTNQTLEEQMAPYPLPLNHVLKISFTKTVLAVFIGSLLLAGGLFLPLEDDPIIIVVIMRVFAPLLGTGIIYSGIVTYFTNWFFIKVDEHQLVIKSVFGLLTFEWVEIEEVVVMDMYGIAMIGLVGVKGLSKKPNQTIFDRIRRKMSAGPNGVLVSLSVPMLKGLDPDRFCLTICEILEQNKAASNHETENSSF